MMQRLLCASILVFIAGPLAQGDDTKDPSKGKLPLSPKSFKRWGQAEALFTARLNAVQPGPVGLSNPPLYSTRLQFTVDDVLRGTLKNKEKVQGMHSVRQQDRPTFPEGKDCIVAAKKARGYWVIQSVEPYTKEELAQAKLVCSLPVGWTMNDKGLVSPWAKMGKKAWPEAQKGTGRFECTVTGRPAYTLGNGIKLDVEKVPPAVKLKYGNPDGDGEYRITITNTTDKPVEVPALRTNGKKILWQECVVILCQDKVYPAPEANGIKSPTKPVTLKPGQSISSTVHALKLDGPKWPRGGYRIEFQFCVGDKSVTKSFYYLSRHHDKIRTDLLKDKN